MPTLTLSQHPAGTLLFIAVAALVLYLVLVYGPTRPS